jgi:LacI family transcriptional regulator
MKKVILIVDTSRSASRQFLRGIERYIHTNDSWEVYTQPPDYLSGEKKNFHKWIQQNHFDGIIVRDSQNLQDILKLKIPKTVFETTCEDFPGIATISTDSYSISKMAADYFIGLGFRNFAFCGVENLFWSKGRQDAYQGILSENENVLFFQYNCPHGTHNMVIERRNISNWLKKLPKPLCVFACNDDIGVYILEVCKITGLKVPEEIAVLGVDNDELVCNLSSPGLSSIKIDVDKAGFEAAEALDKQMKGGKSVANIMIRAKARYLIKRQSTDIIAVNDKDITKALIFIRENFNKPIQVEDVVNATCFSRRMLERRFNTDLKRSVTDEINRLRTEYLKMKLMNSRIPIHKIVESLGYIDYGHFSRFFKKLTSMSPTEYRRRNKNTSG